MLPFPIFYEIAGAFDKLDQEETERLTTFAGFIGIFLIFLGSILGMYTSGSINLIQTIAYLTVLVIVSYMIYVGLDVLFSRKEKGDGK